MNLAAELARRLLAALPGEHDPRLIPPLAAALSRGLGVVPDPTPGTRLVYIVLGSPLDAVPLDAPDFIPTFLVGQRSRRQRQYLRKTGAVAWFFRCAARGGKRLKPPASGSLKWARASTDSLAWVPIEGDISEDPPTTPDPDGFGDYEWFALRDQPVGSIFYRVDSAGKLTLFQRLTIDRKLWGRIVLPAQRDAVDVWQIINDLRGEYGHDLVLPKVPGEITLLAPVPDIKTTSPLLQSPGIRRQHRRAVRAAAV